MNRFTIKEFSAKLGISESATGKKVKKLINEIEDGTSKLNEVDFKFTEEIEHGYKTGVVYCSNEALGYIKENTKSVKGFQESFKVNNAKNGVQNGGSEANLNVTQDDFVKSLILQLIEAKNEVVNYAKEAGQVKLLTDNLINKEGDAKHWQEQYFKLKYDYDKLQDDNKKLQLAVTDRDKRIQDLSGEIEKFKARKWWRFK